MSKWNDDLKAIAGEIDRKDERIEYFHRLAVSRLEQILSAEKRIAELEEEVRMGAILVAQTGDRNRELETELRITQAALARATAVVPL